MYKYLVVRQSCLYNKNDGLRQRMQHTEYWPMIVEMPLGTYHTPEEVVRVALDSINEGYRPNYEYVVVLMNSAKIVSFRKPEPEYITNVRNF